MKKIFIVFILMFLICLVGCSGESDEPKTVVSISIDESTIPERILVSKLEEELAKIKVEVTFSDNTTQIISLSKSMIFPNDVDKLMSGGKYKLKVTYEFITTDIILHTFLVFPVIYSINVVKPDGSPVADTNIILYKNNETYRSLTTDSNGTCSVELNPNYYTFKIDLLEKGYSYLKTECFLDENVTNKTITLASVSEISEGDGSSLNNYVLNCGLYCVSFEEENVTGMKYFEFTASETTTYTIESVSYSNYTEKSVDPYLIFIDKDGNFDKSGNLDSIVNVDFKYSFEAEAGKTYNFMIFISTASEYPVNLLLNIYK